MSWHGKSPVPPLFHKGALHSLWIDFELSSKKFNGELGSSSSSVFVEWTELELTAEFNAVNWTWIKLFELYTALFKTMLRPKVPICGGPQKLVLIIILFQPIVHKHLFCWHLASILKAKKTFLHNKVAMKSVITIALLSLILMIGLSHWKSTKRYRYVQAWLHSENNQAKIWLWSNIKLLP